MLLEKDLQHYAHFHFPINRFVLALTQKPMRLLYKLERSDAEVHVSEKVINAVRVLLYEPARAKEKSTCMIFFHGGGFVFNAAPHHFNLVRKFVKNLGIKCVFVDYRLAPKYKFPCAPNDCFEVYRWMLENTRELSIDAEKIILCGDSAGGNLAVMTCLRARDEKLSLPLAQMLLYPVLDHKMQTKSYEMCQNTPMCNSRDMAKYYRMYLPDEMSSSMEYISPYISPFESTNLSNLPQTYIEVAQYDCLHDEGVAFAQALKNNSVKVELHEVSGAMHGYDIAQNSKFMEKIMRRRVEFIENIL